MEIQCDQNGPLNPRRPVLVGSSVTDGWTTTTSGDLRGRGVFMSVFYLPKVLFSCLRCYSARCVLRNLEKLSPVGLTGDGPNAFWRSQLQTGAAACFTSAQRALFLSPIVACMYTGPSPTDREQFIPSLRNTTSNPAPEFIP